MPSRILKELYFDVLLITAFLLLFYSLTGCSTEVCYENNVSDALVYTDANLVGVNCHRLDGSPKHDGEGIRGADSGVVPGEHDPGSPVVTANGEVSQEVPVCLDPCGRGGFLESPRTAACCPEGTTDIECLELYAGNAHSRCSCGEGRRCYLPPESLRNQLSGYCLPSQ